MDRDEVERRSIEANRLLENEIFQEALDHLETEYIRLSIDGADIEDREEARRYVKLVRAIEGHIQAIARGTGWLMENNND